MWKAIRAPPLLMRISIVTQDLVSWEGDWSAAGKTSWVDEDDVGEDIVRDSKASGIIIPSSSNSNTMARNPRTRSTITRMTWTFLATMTPATTRAVSTTRVRRRMAGHLHLRGREGHVPTSVLTLRFTSALYLAVSLLSYVFVPLIISS